MIRCFTKSTLRWGLIGAMGLGGLTLPICPDRVAAGFDQVRVSVAGLFDDFVDDPVALRRQLETLASQYPDRIAEVRGEVAEVEHQIEQLRHDSEVADRVVAMTTSDLSELREVVANAEAEAASGRTVAFRRGLSSVDGDQARSEARRIANVRSAYEDRLASNTTQISFLTQQRDRLSEILDRLEHEYGEFETKLLALDRQIDAIERNERLIVMTEEQQAILSDYERLGRVGNLGQLEAKLAELRTVQEAQLQTLANRGVKTDYERIARDELSVQRTSDLLETGVWDELDPIDEDTATVVDDLAWLER